jgi:DNA-binding MarR family transcriptional regulator
VSNPELLLSNQLCFLVHRLDREISTRYRPLLSELGLTYPQYLAMLALWEHGELTVGEFCGLLYLDTGTVSPLLKRLESAGFVIRQRRRDDERSVTITLSESGRALEEKARTVPGTMASYLLPDAGGYHALKATLSGLITRLERSACPQA